MKVQTKIRHLIPLDSCMPLVKECIAKNVFLISLENSK